MIDDKSDAGSWEEALALKDAINFRVLRVSKNALDDAVPCTFYTPEELEAMQIKDAVNPDHYKRGGIEAIDYIQAKLTPEEFAGYCLGNMLKYLSRLGHKDEAAQEMRKAIWYGERWLQARDTRAQKR
jgi:hypothetical protein